MESFENQNFPNPETPPQPPTDSAAAQQNPQSTTGATAGAPGKSSPYADSPFEVNPQRGTSEYTYQPKPLPSRRSPASPWANGFWPAFWWWHWWQAAASLPPTP